MKRPIAAVVGNRTRASRARDDESRLCGHRNRDLARMDLRAERESSSAASRKTATPLARWRPTPVARRWSVPACIPGQLDAIVLSTATPDRLLPATAVDLQAELGATRAAAFDIGAACSGWLYANDQSPKA